jgi:tetratricopeptide (TPR) repeat protein
MIFCDLRNSYAKGFRQLTAALGGNGSAPSPKAKAQRTRPAPNKQRTIERLYNGQKELLAALAAGDVAQARRLQAKLDPVMNDALRRWRSDDVILNLGGYHLKNAYQLKYWDRPRLPTDAMLGKAEQLFHGALGIDPDDPSAKNGLGNIYWLRKNLDAAEFFVKHAIEKARKKGLRYPEAEQDLKGIREEKSQQAARV